MQFKKLGDIMSKKNSEIKFLLMLYYLKQITLFGKCINFFFKMHVLTYYDSNVKAHAMKKL